MNNERLVITEQKLFRDILILVLACAPFGQTAVCNESQNAGTSVDPNGWQKLNLGSTRIAGATIYYEKRLEPNLPLFERQYKKFLAGRKTSDQILSKKDQVIADINKILGITRPNTKKQAKIFTALLGVFSEAEPTFYLVTKATTKDFLRAGGRLPNCTYDKATDMVQYEPEFETTSTEGPIKEFELAMPVASGEKFEGDVTTIFQILQQLVGTRMFDIAIHEATELSLLRRARPTGPCWRWFSDGFANAITFNLLNKHVGKEAAQEFAAAYDVSGYEDLEKEINLQYWMSLQFCVLRTRSPIEYESRLGYARYVYATREAQRFIGEHGLGCIHKILDEVSGKQSRTGADLLQAIKKVTGEDMQQRLSRYQTFRTREEGLAKYSGLFNAASDKKDYEKMLINLLRIMELREDAFSDDYLEGWKNAAWLLFKLGHEEAGDKVMRNCIELYEKSSVPHGREVAAEMFIVYALQCSNPQKAQKTAEELLKNRPNNVPSLAIKMLVLAEAGAIADAQQMAKKIQSLAKSEESPCYKIASRILAIDPSRQRLER